MTQFLFASISIGLLLLINLWGFVLSILAFKNRHFAEQRIQERKIGIKIFLDRLGLISFNIFLLSTLSFFGLYYIFPFMNQGLEFNFLIILFQLFIMLILDDFFFYFLHRWLHKNKWALRKIHRYHHIASAPFALDYIYAHPLEWLLGYIGPFIGIMIFLQFGELSCWTIWIYIFFRNMHEVDIHSGIKSRISQYIPFWGTSEHHDLHHAKLEGNYASTFTIWDSIMRTKIK